MATIWVGRSDGPTAIEDMLREWGIEPPKHWDKYSRLGKLDYIATRILANSRTTTSHTQMREEGILSVSQYDRRLAREVFSSHGSLDQIPPDRGVFGRVHRKISRPGKGLEN